MIWDAFGNVPNYVEPFAGSLAVLLARPHAPKVETVNDLDCYLTNFWRAVQADPDAVAHWADWPVSELDQNARHLWLVSNAELRERMNTDPEYYDAKAAGWWVWGINGWIGDSWCHSRFWRDSEKTWQQLPALGDAGKGVNRKSAALIEWMRALQDRLRNVRICCGRWDRVIGPSVTIKHGTTAVFLDPPYATENDGEYAVNEKGVAHEVAAWAFANGDNPELRIALCGYEGEHAPPKGWTEHAWKARKGYQKATDGKHSGHKETVWFSPHCLPVGGRLFAEGVA